MGGREQARLWTCTHPRAVSEPRGAIRFLFFHRFTLVTDLLELAPLWVIIESIANQDCPAALDALTFLYIAFCVLGAFLIALAITWLVAAQRLPTDRIAPEQGEGSPDDGKGNPPPATDDNDGQPLISSQPTPVAPPV